MPGKNIEFYRQSSEKCLYWPTVPRVFPLCNQPKCAHLINFFNNPASLIIANCCTATVSQLSPLSKKKPSNIKHYCFETRKIKIQQKHLCSAKEFSNILDKANLIIIVGLNMSTSSPKYASIDESMIPK